MNNIGLHPRKPSDAGNFQEIQNAFQLARIHFDTCTSFPSQASPHSCSPSTVGVPSARKRTCPPPRQNWSATSASSTRWAVGFQRAAIEAENFHEQQMHRNRSFSNILHFSSPAAMSVVRTVARLRCALCRLARASLSPCLLTIAACGPFCTVFELPQFAATRDQDVLPRRHHTEDATHTHGLLAMSEARGRLWAPSAKSAPSAHHVLVSTPTPQTECQLRVACITSSPRTRWLGSQRCKTHNLPSQSLCTL